MSTHRHFELDRIAAEPQLGATEITAFAATPANDNISDGRALGRPRRRPRLMVPAIAFSSGLVAAFVVAGLGHALGIV